jgi:polyhydroxyalkanoate synthase subunit PhaE
MNDFWQIPTLGFTREFNHQLFETVEAWLNLQRASFDYQLVLLEVWLKTFEEVLRVLSSPSENVELLYHWQRLLQVWSEIFDRTFAETFQSEHSLMVRGKFMNTALTFRKQQQQLVETFLKWNNLPTRSEIDEIHRSIYELRKEMKHLKKEVVASQKG